MYDFTMLTFSLLSQDSSSVSQNEYFLETIEKEEILDLKTKPHRILNLDKLDVGEFNKDPLSIFQLLFDILPEDGCFSFGNQWWHGFNLESGKEDLLRIFEERTTGRLKKMTCEEFERYLRDFLTQEDYQTLFSQKDPNLENFQRKFLSKENRQMRQQFFQKIDHKKFVSQEMIYGNLNPFYQWNWPQDYQGIKKFEPSCSLHKAYQRQLKDFFKPLGFQDIVYHKSSRRWIVKKEYPKSPSRNGYFSYIRKQFLESLF